MSWVCFTGVKRTVILCDGSSGGRASGIREKADSVFPFRRERSAGRDLGSDGKLRKVKTGEPRGGEIWALRAQGGVGTLTSGAKGSVGVPPRQFLC